MYQGKVADGEMPTSHQAGDIGRWLLDVWQAFERGFKTFKVDDVSDKRETAGTANY